MLLREMVDSFMIALPVLAVNSCFHYIPARKICLQKAVYRGKFSLIHSFISCNSFLGCKSEIPHQIILPSFLLKPGEEGG